MSMATDLNRPTAKPSSICITSRNHWAVDVGLAARLDAPLVADKVAVAVSFSDTSREGYLFNTVLQKHINELDATTARLALRFDPSENLEVLLHADYLDSKVFRQGSMPD